MVVYQGSLIRLASLTNLPVGCYVHPAVTRITLISSWVCWPDWPPDDIVDLFWRGYIPNGRCLLVTVSLSN